MSPMIEMTTSNSINVKPMRTIERMGFIVIPLSEFANVYPNPNYWFSPSVLVSTKLPALSAAGLLGNWPANRKGPSDEPDLTNPGGVGVATKSHGSPFDVNKVGVPLDGGFIPPYIPSLPGLKIWNVCLFS